MPDPTHGEKPYTTEALTDEQIDEMPLPDQIRYAIYVGMTDPDEIAEATTHDDGWARSMIDDMVQFDDLHSGAEDAVMLPADERPPDDDPDDEPDDDPDPTDDMGTGKVERGEKAAAEVAADPDPDADSEADSNGADADEEADESDGSDTTDDGDDADDTPETDPETTLDQTPDDTVEVSDGPDPDAATGQLPVNRDYDWAEETIDRSRVEEYVSADGEYEDIKKEVQTRDETGKLPRFQIVGPTGCGKTSIGENIAADLDDLIDRPVPVFDVQCHDGLRPNNLLGLPTYVGDETWWADGPITKALLASREGPTVLIFDELNRTDARTLGVIMSVLDHQCSVTLNARGGEQVRGDPMNLIVIATMNEGKGYVVNQIDRAQLRRFGNTIPTDYVGMHDPSAEAELVADRTPIAEEVAETFVRAANDLREKADDDSAVQMGVPTSSVMEWARTAWAYRGDNDADGGPAMKAGERSIIDTFYRDNSDVRNVAYTTLESHVADMSVYPEHERPIEDVSGVGDAKAEALRSAGYADVEDLKRASQQDLSAVDGIGNALASRIKADVGDPDQADEAFDVSDATWFVCQACGWSERSEDAPDEVGRTMMCPDCGDTVRPRENEPDAN